MINERQCCDGMCTLDEQDGRGCPRFPAEESSAAEKHAGLWLAWITLAICLIAAGMNWFWLFH